ncbi:DEAD/DEAH box helicase [Flavobacterium rivuli WB 3.3-2 = DSM 21788]|uniref:DEAD/DEAH box helicase n=1 Tax=Flavobacterium rivuli WB 3.3-2 = DSM 21788 TaxID=1121895 RepID=A0A0A2M454_9FLAO|nr:DEAD/DEAH box helicase [Flavobacterium rivuli]KGO87059.1 DEAD/DEAH box helicase [Flavobacterium rivuli WB 3.3-2 = DSM 21788]
MSFDLLSEPIRKYIRDKQWEQLRPIQSVAIQHILCTDNHYILASRTASGKTEAAFLPILSKVNFNDPGVQVLYISPLIALINDQFYRVEDLCKSMEVTVTKWHGEANKGLKEKLIKNPSGVVLITPESIEAMFVNKPYNVKQLFANLKFVVIDEIHTFIGSDRGIQLKSLLSRLQDINVGSFRIIGLSATIGDYNEAKKFTGNEDKTVVLLDRTKKDINAVFRYFEADTPGMTPLALLKDLYVETCNSKALIFPNNRGRAEEIAVNLKKISDRVKGHPNYFSHHSSVHKEVREYVEYFAKNSNHHNFCIACTSTLELGIDIGNVDEVVQIDATNSIASLIQRVGRSGRREGATSNLFLYATEKWSLLQSVACWLLYKEGYIEPPAICKKPYDLLLHQALSIVKGHSGILVSELILRLKGNFAFKEIEECEIIEIIGHLIVNDMLEKLQHEVIIGVEGEKIVNSKDFYTVFTIEESFKVVNAGYAIGEIPWSPQIREDENILLAAKIWKIIFVDFKAKKIEVLTAKDGKPPKFFGGGGVTDVKVRQKMLQILYDYDDYDFLNEACLNKLKEMRDDFATFKIMDIDNERPMLISEKHLRYYTFAGTKINRTLNLLYNMRDLDANYDEYTSSFKFDITAIASHHELLQLPGQREDWDSYIGDRISNGILPDSKWGGLLPHKFQISIMRQKYYDIDGAMDFLEHIKIVSNL